MTNFKKKKNSEIKIMAFFQSFKAFLKTNPIFDNNISILLNR